jgi:hypothetical protein
MYTNIVTYVSACDGESDAFSIKIADSLKGMIDGFYQKWQFGLVWSKYRNYKEH